MDEFMKSSLMDIYISLTLTLQPPDFSLIRFDLSCSNENTCLGSLHLVQVKDGGAWWPNIVPFDILFENSLFLLG